MRKVILTQKKRASGRLFELGSLVMDRGQVPLTMGFNFADPTAKVGYADHMKLDAQSGEVSMEIHLNPGFTWTKEMDELYDFTFGADQVEARGSVPLNTQVVSRCRLTCVVIVPLSAMPGAVVKNGR